MSDDDVSMIEPDTRMRVFARYLWVCRGWKRSVAITTGGAVAGVYPVNERSCVRACVWKLHTPRMIRRSRAGLRYSAAMRVAILVYRSCCLPFALVLLSHPDSPPLFVHPLSLPVKSSFFSALPSLRVRSTPRARFSLPLLFRSAFCPSVSSRARGRASLTSSAASYSSNSCRRIENSIHAFGIQQW